jgi:oligopeptide transport system permease protein
MLRYIVYRLLWSIPVLLGITLTTFLIARAIPGGPFDAVGDRVLPQEVIDNLKAKYHLDWPVWKQFVSYLIGDELLDPQGKSKGIIRGDLGISYRYRGQTVTEMVRVSLPVSMQLGILAILLALLIGIPAGVIAALYRNSMVDYGATFVAVLGVSIPNLVLGPLLIWIFAVKLGWLPAALWGAKPPFILGLLPEPSGDFLSHAILPTLTLGTGLSAGIARLTRASLLQVLREDYIRTARAKGLRERWVVIRHALRNSLIPVVTILGPMAAAVLTGTFVVEQIFGIPGMGKYFVAGISNRDYTVITGVTLIYSVFLVLANLLVDISYAWLDPRVVYE